MSPHIKLPLQTGLFERKFPFSLCTDIGVRVCASPARWEHRKNYTAGQLLQALLYMDKKLKVLSNLHKTSSPLWEPAAAPYFLSASR